MPNSHGPAIEISRKQEDQVSNAETRFGGRETIRGNYIRKLGEKVGDTLRGGKKVGRTEET